MRMKKKKDKKRDWLLNYCILTAVYTSVTDRKSVV